LTFVPLAKITAPPTKHIVADNARPLLAHLEFAPIFAPVMAQVFGKTYLCSELKEASLFARTHGVDCVTLNGDKVSKKGTLSGGFHDIRSSRIEKMTRITV
jgi:structural maintenance of chromosome 3 (chondroitin sulfate proteoglycan 6)